MRFADHICCLHFRQCHNFWLPQKAQISPCGNLLAVSQLAVEEYETLHDTFNLERDLRTEAENYARAVSFCLFVWLFVQSSMFLFSILLMVFSQMVVEQKKLKRQSQILMQSSSPSQALQDALSQVTRLTEELETQRLEHQSQVWYKRRLDVAWDSPVKIMNFLFNTKNGPLHTDVYKATTGWSDKITPD